jgi:CO/xanthine dehydrogenase Mo-binding subunit
MGHWILNRQFIVDPVIDVNIWTQKEEELRALEAQKTTIGHSVTRVDVHAKVTGEALYPGDINFPNQAYMKIHFAKQPHAIVKKIDTFMAEALPGVLAVFTAKDVPVNEYGLIMADQPVLCGPGSTNLFADRVRFIGDQLALVIAETESIAEIASELIDVDYEELPVITDP